MTRQLEIERILDGFLAEGAHQLADHVLDAALGDINTTRQRRSWWPPRRFADMNNAVRIAVAAAAVAVVAIVGYNLLPGPGDVGGSPTPSPTAAPMPREGEVPAGTYRMGDAPSFLITVPPGWHRIGPLSLRKNVDQPTEVALDLYPADIQVFADACQSELTEESVGPTTEDLIAALVAQENSDISDPVDVTVAGLPGKRFEISAPAGLDTDQCSIGSLQILVDARHTNWLAGIGAGETTTVVVVDTPEGRLLFSPNRDHATTADIAELDAIIASIRVAP